MLKVQVRAAVDNELRTLLKTAGRVRRVARAGSHTDETTSECSGLAWTTGRGEPEVTN